MRHLRSVWLVARREIIERGRSRGFIFSVLFTTAIVIGSFVIPAVLLRDDEATAIGALAPVPAGLEASLAAVAASLESVVVLTEVPDRAAGDAALADESITARSSCRPTSEPGRGALPRAAGRDHRAHGRRRGQPAPLDVDPGRAGRRSRCPCHDRRAAGRHRRRAVGPDDEAAVCVATSAPYSSSWVSSPSASRS